MSGEVTRTRCDGRTRASGYPRPQKSLWGLVPAWTLALLSTLPTVAVEAQNRGVDADAGRPDNPRTLDLANEKIEALIREERARLDELRAARSEESAELVQDRRLRTQKIFDLRREEHEATLELQTIADELAELEEELAKAREEKDFADIRYESFQSEVAAQMSDFEERFKGSLLGTEHADLVERANALATAYTDRPEDQESTETLDEILDLYERVLEEARVVSAFRTPIRLAGTSGEVEEVDVLRMGLLSAIYANPKSGEAGFVQAAGEGNSGFKGVAAGLDSSQQERLAQFIEKPQGTLPFDVTLGQGIATLESRTTLSRWFEGGGVFMYGLLAIAIIALLLTIERAIVLTLRSAGMKRKIDRVLRLVQDGRIEEAEELCAGKGGATNAVLHAALVHHGQERSVIEDSVQEALLHNAPKFQSRLSFIALCAAVSPLVGLLGTVTGMITTFTSITLFGTSDPRTMAGGIGEALITTQGGLYVAIPCLLFRGVLGAAADSALGKLEAGAMSVVLALVEQQEEVDPENDYEEEDADYEDGLVSSDGEFLIDELSEDAGFIQSRRATGGEGLESGEGSPR